MFVAFFVGLSCSALISAHEEKSFLAWMREHNRLYTGDEYSFRLGIFLTNAAYIQEFNKNGKFQLSANHFAAMTPAEYRSLLTKTRRSVKQQPKTETNYQKAIPDEIDWRTRGIVNPICDQMSCGSGWAFASTCAQESQWALQKEELYALSPQNVLDCCWKCEGCDNGEADTATYYVMEEQEGKWMLDNDYPYIGHARQCKYEATKGVTFTKKILYTKTADEKDMKEKCAQYGVLAAEMDASLASFAWYSSGIYEEPECNPWNLCHSVNVVGYGVSSGVDYWLFRNSF